MAGYDHEYLVCYDQGQWALAMLAICVFTFLSFGIFFSSLLSNVL